MDYDQISKATFSWFDYILFFSMLGLSVLIGIYFGWFNKNKRQSKKEYLLGGKSMDVLPISISLIASQVSGITLLAVPADIYRFGSNYIWLCLAVPIVCTINNYIFLPLFFDLQFTSIYEYLNLRFHKRIQILASFLFILSIFLHNPIVIYIPALAFAQATGVDLHITIVFVCIICVFYTTVGGFKAVVWTDTLQFIGMIGSIAAVLLLGAASANGFFNVFHIAKMGNRLDVFDFSLNPTVRDGVWPILIGGSVQYMSYICFNQGVMQKFLAVPTLSSAKQVLFIYCFGVILIMAATVLTGNILYARYYDCDPISTNKVSRVDQILPYFVLEIAQGLPGLPGLFVAGIFSASLSTFSASLNTAASAIYQDFILPRAPTITKERESKVLKAIVVISGAASTILALFVERMRGMLQFSIAVSSIAAGPMMGIFILGTLFPSANTKGAFYGCLTGMLFISWVVIGNQWYLSQGLIEEFAKPVSTLGCNSSIIYNNQSRHLIEEPFMLYRISCWYNCVMGSFVVVFIGLIVSWFSKEEKSSVEPNLIYKTHYTLLK